MSESAFVALQHEAERRNISVNTLHNLLLLTYSEHDRLMDQFHMVRLSLPTFRKILHAATSEAIADAGRSAGANIPKSFALVKNGEFSLDSAIDFLRISSQYARLFEFNSIRNSGDTTITLVHELGEKGSLFFAEYVGSMFGEVGVSVKTITKENSVTFELLSTLIDTKPRSSLSPLR